MAKKVKEEQKQEEKDEKEQMTRDATDDNQDRPTINGILHRWKKCSTHQLPQKLETILHCCKCYLRTFTLHNQ
jgi:hypothetical protein